MENEKFKKVKTKEMGRYFSLGNFLGPLRTRNVRLFAIGDLAFYMSFWLIYINLAWLAYDFTHSSFKLGLLGGLFYLPFLIFMPISGVLADRLNRHKVIVVGQILLFIPVIVLIFLSYTNRLTYSILIIIALVFSSINAFSMPSGQALIEDIIEDKTETHRIMGFINTNLRTSQFASSAINSLVHFILSFTTSFIIALFFNILAMINFLKIKPPAHTLAPKPRTHFWKEMLQGFHYVFRFSPFWSVILLATIVNVFVAAYQFQLPIFIGSYLKGNVHMLSYIYLVGGIGGIIGGVYLGIRKKSRNLMVVASIGLAIVGLSLVIFAFSRNIVLSLFLSFWIDAGYVIVLAACSAALLIIVADSMRGRAMGIYFMAFVGLIPIGNILVGLLAEYTSATIAICILGLICLLIAGWYLFMLNHFRNLLKEIYKEKSLKPEDQPI